MGYYSEVMIAVTKKDFKKVEDAQAKMTVATILPPLYNISRKREASRPLDLRASFGANDVTRTHDLLITNQLLYRLSHTSIPIA